MVRSVHPLGRAMDQLQEDLEAMQREYTFWQHVSAAAAAAVTCSLAVSALPRSASLLWLLCLCLLGVPVPPAREALLLAQPGFLTMEASDASEMLAAHPSARERSPACFAACSVDSSLRFSRACSPLSQQERVTRARELQEQMKVVDSDMGPMREVRAARGELEPGPARGRRRSILRPTLPREKTGAALRRGFSLLRRIAAVPPRIRHRVCPVSICACALVLLGSQIEAVELEMARTREAIASMKQDIAKNDATVKDLLTAIMNGGVAAVGAPR